MFHPFPLPLSPIVPMATATHNAKTRYIIQTCKSQKQQPMSRAKATLLTTLLLVPLHQVPVLFFPACATGMASSKEKQRLGRGGRHSSPSASIPKHQTSPSYLSSRLRQCSPMQFVEECLSLVTSLSRAGVPSLHKHRTCEHESVEGGAPKTHKVRTRVRTMP